MKNLKEDKIIYLFLILQPLIDLVTSLMTRFSEMPLTLGVVVRGSCLILLVIYTLFFTKTKYKNKTLLYFLGIVLFIFIYFLSKRDIFQFKYLKSEIIYLFKYFYFPVVSVCLLNCYHKINLSKEKLNMIMIINAIVFSLLIIIPFITNTGFSSYLDTSKGNVGWFYSANEIGAILTMLFPYLYCFLQKKSQWKFLLASVVLTFSMMIIGTKTAFLGMILTEVVFLVCYLIRKERAKKIGSYLGILALSLILIPCLPAISNLQSSIDNNINDSTSEEVEHVEVPTNSYVDKTLNIILSGRQNFLYDTMYIYSKENSISKLFGIGFVNRDSINDKKIEKLIEIDPLDIFFHYGIIGFIIYFLPLIYIFSKSIYNVFKRKLKLSFYQLLYLYAVALLIFISCIAGHILSSPSVSIYLCFSLVLLYYELNVNIEKKLKEDEITIMALHLGYGGTEQYLSSLCKMLNDNYKINIIVTYKVQDKPAFYFDDKINITYLIDDKPNKEEFMDALNNKNIISLFREGVKSLKLLFLRRFKNIRAIKKIDSKYIITTRYFHNKLVGLYADYNIIKIATEHNYHNNDNKYIKKVITSLRCFDYFICVSNNLKEFYDDKIKGTKCIFIPNVIDYLPSEGSLLENNCLIHVGRFEKEKGQLDLIDVVLKVKQKVADIKLYMIGDGSYRERLEEKVKENNLEKNVIFTGFISKDEMKKYYLNSKLFVLTSYTEAFGLVLIESMSYKVPCIAFDSADGACELLKNNVGILVKERNKDKMAKEIIRLLNHKKELMKYSDNGYKSCQKYLINNVKEEWLNILSND